MSLICSDTDHVMVELKLELQNALVHIGITRKILTDMPI